MQCGRYVKPLERCEDIRVAHRNTEQHAAVQAHERAWLRTMAVGRTWAGKAALLGWQRGYALCLWLLCVYMALVEWYTRGDWLQQD